MRVPFIFSLNTSILSLFLATSASALDERLPLSSIERSSLDEGKRSPQSPKKKPGKAHPVQKKWSPPEDRKPIPKLQTPELYPYFKTSHYHLDNPPITLTGPSYEKIHGTYVKIEHNETRKRIKKIIHHDKENIITKISLLFYTKNTETLSRIIFCTPDGTPNSLFNFVYFQTTNKDEKPLLHKIEHYNITTSPELSLRRQQEPQTINKDDIIFTVNTNITILPIFDKETKKIHKYERIGPLLSVYKIFYNTKNKIIQDIIKSQSSITSHRDYLYNKNNLLTRVNTYINKKFTSALSIHHNRDNKISKQTKSNKTGDILPMKAYEALSLQNRNGITQQCCFIMP